MRFVKEIVTIVVILIIVFSTEYITSKNLNEAVSWMKDGLTSMENKMNENKESEAQEEFCSLEEKWKKEVEKLSLFVEHNELENVSNYIVVIESNFETNDTDKVMENLAELKFLLDHIEEKNQLKLKNIF